MKDLLCDRFEASLCGKFHRGVLVGGLNELGRNVVTSVGIVGNCVIGACVVIAW